MAKYPTPEKLARFNEIVLEEIKAKKADKPKVLSRSKLAEAIKGCKTLRADVYGKAACLLKGLVKAHAFASGNRRTAFLAAIKFLEENNAKAFVKDNEKQAEVMKGIREDFYSDKEIINWIKTGEIREFRR